MQTRFGSIAYISFTLSICSFWRAYRVKLFFKSHWNLFRSYMNFHTYVQRIPCENVNCLTEGSFVWATGDWLHWKKIRWEQMLHVYKIRISHYLLLRLLKTDYVLHPDSSSIFTGAAFTLHKHSYFMQFSGLTLSL